ncbi:MAG: GntR family transcriptional regulator [Lachnospiraceae bacterium]
MPEANMSLKDMVYQKIVEMICAGELTTDLIFTENQMIEQFNVSKSPVREALIQLCHEEVLKSIPRCGYQVIEINAKSIRDLTELRLYLELSSLPKVMESLSQERINQLKEINNLRLYPKHEKNVWSAWENNVRFHMALIEFAENIQVNKVMERTLATCTRAYAQLFAVQKSIIATNNESCHDQITCALENHDIYTAHEFLKADVLFMEAQLLSANIIR